MASEEERVWWRTPRPEPEYCASSGRLNHWLRSTSLDWRPSGSTALPLLWAKDKSRNSTETPGAQARRRLTTEKER